MCDRAAPVRCGEELQRTRAAPQTKGHNAVRPRSGDAPRSAHLPLPLYRLPQTRHRNRVGRTRIPRRDKHRRQRPRSLPPMRQTTTPTAQPSGRTLRPFRRLVTPMPRAPRICGRNGCARTVPAGQRCPAHKHGWGKGNPRTSTPQHRAWRAQVLRNAGYQCEIRDPGICTGTATIADHIKATAFGGAHYEVTNGQAACQPCSRKKSSDEGHIAQGHTPK